MTELKSTSHGQTMVLSIASTNRHQVLRPEIYSAGIEALNAAERNPEVRSVVITGEGDRFCGGHAVERLLAHRQQTHALDLLGIEGLHSWIEAIRTFPKPVLAAVEGVAADAGFSLALACDLIVAGSDASFVLSQGKLGLSVDGGASWNLARQLPRQLASELLLCGEPIGAQRLHTLGLVNRITPRGAALQTALALADTLNAGAANALASAKELVTEADTRTLSGQLAAERDHLLRNLHHGNSGVGLRAAMAGEIPRFS